MSSGEEISENVKQAREQALVGNYEDAKVFYSGAVHGVQQMLKQIHEPDKKQKWREVGGVRLDVEINKKMMNKLFTLGMGKELYAGNRFCCALFTTFFTLPQGPGYVEQRVGSCEVS